MSLKESTIMNPMKSQENAGADVPKDEREKLLEDLMSKRLEIESVLALRKAGVAPENPFDPESSPEKRIEDDKEILTKQLASLEDKIARIQGERTGEFVGEIKSDAKQFLDGSYDRVPVSGDHSVDRTKPESYTERALGEFESIGLSVDFVRRTVPGFDALTEGQQLLLARQMRQVARGRVEEEAEEEVKREPETGESGTESTSKFIRAISSIWRSSRKESRKAGARKRAGESLKKDGETAYGPILAQMSQIMNNAEFPPEVVIDEKTGELRIQFLSEREYQKIRGNEESAKIEGSERLALERFNKAAAEFSKLPKAWSGEDAKLIDRGRYMLAERKYEQTKKRLEKAMGTEKFDADTFQSFARMERDVRLMQHMSADPDIDNSLFGLSRAIENSSFLSYIKTNLVEKAAFAGFGYGARALSAGVFGFIGAPIAAFAMGAGRAWGRAKETLREEKRAGQKGESKMPDRELLDAEYRALGGKKSRSKKEEERYQALSSLLVIKRDPEMQKLLQKKREAKEQGEEWAPEDAKRYEALKSERQKEVIEAYATVYGTGKTYIKAAEEPDADHPDDPEKVKHGLSFKLNGLVEDVRKADPGSEEEAAVLKRLHARIAYTTRKLDEGLIDFSGGAGRFVNKAVLLQALANAETMYRTFTKQDDSELEERLNLFLNFQDAKMSEGRKRFIRKKVLWGAGISASVATAAMFGRHFQEVWEGKSEIVPDFLKFGGRSEDVVSGDGTGAAEQAVEVTGDADAKPGDAVSGGAPEATPEASTDSVNDTTVGEEAADAASVAKAAEAVSVESGSGAEIFTIRAERGDGLTHLARRAAREYLDQSGHQELAAELTAEHRIYIEDYLRRRIEFSGMLHPGDEVEISGKAIEEAIAEARNLTDGQLGNLGQYADRVSEFRDMPRFEGEAVGTEEIEAEVANHPDTQPSPEALAEVEAAPESPPSESDTAEVASTSEIEPESSVVRDYLDQNPDKRAPFKGAVGEIQKSIFPEYTSGIDGQKPVTDFFDIDKYSKSFSRMSDMEQSFGRLVYTLYDQLYGDGAHPLINVHTQTEAQEALFPQGGMTVKSYFEDISYILAKKEIDVASIVDRAKSVSAEEVEEFYTSPSRKNPSVLDDRKW